MSVVMTLNEGALKGLNPTAAAGILEAVSRGVSIAKDLAPVDYGELRSSIMWATPKADGGFNEGGISKRAPEKTVSPRAKITAVPLGLQGYYGSNVQHAAPNEFGTRCMAAAPFLRPSAQILRGKDSARIMAALDRRFETEIAMGKKRKVKL